MQTLNWTVGNWKAEAQVEQVESNRLMAIISVTDERGNIPGTSKYTVVFDHKDGRDTLDETRDLVQRLLQARYGI